MEEERSIVRGDQAGWIIFMVDSLERSEADGLCVFTFTDFLDMRETAEGKRRIDRLRAFRR